MQENMPVFVKVDEYKEVLELLSNIKSKVQVMKSALSDIENLKDEEDSEIDSLESGIDEIESKVHYIDQTLFETEGL